MVAQIKRSDGIQYSQPIQLDTASHTFIIGIMPNKTNKDKYLTNSQMYDYGGVSGSIWTNIIVYNPTSKSVNKLFSNTELMAIYPVTGAYGGIASYNNQNISVLFPKFLLLSIKTDYNNDGVIDERDPITLFICGRTGNNLTRVSPIGTNVIAWTLSFDEKVLIAKIEIDKNSDKRFLNEDETIYEIDLDNDLSKVIAVPILVN